MSQSREVGVTNERKVMKHYKDQGYDVLRVDDKGFPDLLVLKDGQLHFTVEVKTGGHAIHRHQREYHTMMASLGLTVVHVRVIEDSIQEEDHIRPP